jgi:hypothetical protein
VTLRVSLTRWRCQNRRCERQTFADRLPQVARSFARRTCRVAVTKNQASKAVKKRRAQRLERKVGR